MVTNNYGSNRLPDGRVIEGWANGIAFYSDVVSIGGAAFELFPIRGKHTRSDVAKAKTQIRNARDAVNFYETWQPEGTVIPGPSEEVPAMTYRELIEHLEPVYDPDGFTKLTDYVTPDGGLVDPPPEGDTLALFVVRELHDVWWADGSPQAKFKDAMDSMSRASGELALMFSTIRRLAHFQGVKT